MGKFEALLKAPEKSLKKRVEIKDKRQMRLDRTLVLRMSFFFLSSLSRGSISDYSFDSICRIKHNTYYAKYVLRKTVC